MSPGLMTTRESETLRNGRWAQNGIKHSLKTSTVVIMPKNGKFWYFWIYFLWLLFHGPPIGIFRAREKIFGKNLNIVIFNKVFIMQEVVFELHNIDLQAVRAKNQTQIDVCKRAKPIIHKKLVSELHAEDNKKPPDATAQVSKNIVLSLFLNTQDADNLMRLYEYVSL